MASSATLSKSKSSAVRKSSSKSPAIQSAVAIKRANGQSKLQIAKDLDIAPNTVTNILALNDIDEQIAKARQGAIDLAPRALTAIDRDLGFPGGGNLGLRLLNDIGAIGEDALESVRRDTVRQRGAINVLVQAGASVTIPSVVESAGNHNVPLSDTTTICSEEQSTVDNCTVPSNNVVTTQAGGRQTPPLGKHPKDGVGHQ